MAVHTADLTAITNITAGTPNLANHLGLVELLKEFYQKDKMLAAICAAPSVLGDLGLLAAARLFRSGSWRGMRTERNAIKTASVWCTVRSRGSTGEGSAS